MLAFAAAAFFLMITPGPGVLTTAGVGSGFGYRHGLRFLTGLMIGTNLAFLAVVTGVAAVIFSYPMLRTVLMFLSIGYLVYLAARIALSGSKISFIEGARPLGYADGALMQLINPKSYVVSTTLFSGFAFLPNDLWTETVLKLLIVNAIFVPVHLLWLAAGVNLRRLALSSPTQTAINAGMATAMLAVVALAAFY